MAQKVYYSERIGRKTFKGSTTKEAYMKAVKWYATNIISNDLFQHVQVEYEKAEDKPEIIMSLYAVMSEKEIIEQHCNICREMHHHFFISEQTDCNRCNAAGFQKRLEQKMSVKTTYYRELLSKIRKEEGDSSDEQED